MSGERYAVLSRRQIIQILRDTSGAEWTPESAARYADQVIEDCAVTLSVNREPRP